MEQKDYRLAAIMYTDIAGFSRMMERDEAGTLQLLKYHNDLIGGIAESHHGRIIKTIGDALLIDFKNTVEALQSAMEVQDKLYQHNRDNPQLPLLVRIGLHLGDIYFFENDALGEGINIAARLQAFAKPGCICFSQDVYNIVLNKIEFHAEKLGKVSLKNITKEIHAYEIVTPNIEFDPNKDKPRPGYPSPIQAETEKKAAEARPEPDQEALAALRREVLEETKALGRRMTATEIRERHAKYGPQLEELVRTLAAQGLIKSSDSDSADDSPPRAEASAFTRPSPAGDFFSGMARNERGEFDSEALKKNIEAAVSGFVSGIENSVERGREQGWGYGPGNGYGYDGHWDHDEEHRARHEAKAARHREKYQRKAERYAGKYANPASDHDLFEAYQGRMQKKAQAARGGIVGHLISYVAVNAFLWFINIQFSPSFLWAAIPTLGWGIGVAANIVGLQSAQRRAREAEAMPELSGQSFADYRQLNRMKDGMAQHASSTVMVCLLLMVINLMVSPASLWGLIPSAAMLVGLFAHAAAYGPGKRRLERSILEALGIEGGWRNIFRRGRARKSEDSDLGDYAGLYREARENRDAIAAQLSSGKLSGSAEMSSSLDEYLGQLRLLAQSAKEIDSLVETIPMEGLAKDKAALEAKAAAAGSESLRTEYLGSIAEIDRQEKSYAELKEQSEVVQLRLKSSANQIKQMRLDIARLSASPNAEGGPDLQAIRGKTVELSRYLEDLRSGYQESEEDPFAALEAAEHKKEQLNLENKNGKEQ